MSSSSKRGSKSASRHTTRDNESEDETIDQEMVSSVLRLYQNSTDAPLVLLKDALEELTNIINCDQGYIAEIKNRNSLVTPKNPNGKYVNILATYGYPNPESKTFEMTDVENPWGVSVIENRIIVGDDPKMRSCPEKHPKITNYAIIPLSFHNESLGQLCVANRKNGFKLSYLRKYEPYFNYLAST